MSADSGVPGYTRQEMECFQEQVKRAFGNISDRVLHDKANLGGIHIDICVVEPSSLDPYYRLLTMGAGAYLMPNHCRAEFMITLPASWPMDLNAWRDENNYWPIRLLQDAARFPVTNGKSLDWYHTLEQEISYAPDTELCACMFTHADKALSLEIAPEKEVRILQIIPLYWTEVLFCHAWNAGQLENLARIKYPNIRFDLIDPKRPCFCESV